MAESLIYDIDAQLERTVDWLKYAEAKNGILVTLLSALLVAFFQQDVLPIWAFYGKLVSISLLCGIMLLLYSFFPVLNLFPKNKWIKRLQRSHYKKMRRNGKKKEPLKIQLKNQNLHYYGCIARMSTEHFIHAVRLSYGECDNKKYFIDVCQQIKINSDIALRKFKLFQKAGYLCILTFVFLVLTA